ncbi:hypothetical protein [Nonomuraea sp. NPDC003804]|uniref:hypothetical protein n=1 Tax=Nonomuraea sp. NPDC003804 TaxID=3154547 RepID=UPI0033A44E4A
MTIWVALDGLRCALCGTEGSLWQDEVRLIVECRECGHRAMVGREYDFGDAVEEVAARLGGDDDWPYGEDLDRVCLRAAFREEFGEDLDEDLTDERYGVWGAWEADEHDTGRDSGADAWGAA